MDIDGVQRGVRSTEYTVFLLFKTARAFRRRYRAPGTLYVLEPVQRAHASYLPNTGIVTNNMDRVRQAQIHTCLHWELRRVRFERLCQPHLWVQCNTDVGHLFCKLHLPTTLVCEIATVPSPRLYAHLLRPFSLFPLILCHRRHFVTLNY